MVWNPLTLVGLLFKSISPIGALKEQVALLNEEKRMLTAENSILKSENAKLNAENRDLRGQIEEREIADAKAAQEKQGTDKDRTDEEYAILAVIVAKREITEYGIAVQLGDVDGKTTERITLSLRRMESDGIICGTAENRWKLTDAGREHLHRREKL